MTFLISLPLTKGANLYSNHEYNGLARSKALILNTALQCSLFYTCSEKFINFYFQITK